MLTYTGPSLRVCCPHLDPISPRPSDLALVRRLPLGTVLDRASHPWVRDRVSVLLGSRDCFGPIWMRCLLCVNQGKEAARGHQVLTLNIHGKIWKRGQ